MKILIVEDEFIIAESLILSIQDLGYTTLEPKRTYEEAIEAIEQDAPDMIILDIGLAGDKSGVDLGNKINTTYNIPFIYLTSQTDKNIIQQAKVTEPYAILIKPYHDLELYSAIELALYNYSLKENKPIKAINKVLENSFFIKQKREYHRIDYADIVFLQSDSIYIDIHTQTDKYIVRDSLEDYLQKLPEGFTRVHRSYIVNINYVKKMDSTHVFVGEHKIPIGKKYKLDFFNQFTFN